MSRSVAKTPQPRPAVRRLLEEHPPRRSGAIPSLRALGVRPASRTRARCARCGRYFDRLCVCGACEGELAVRGTAPWIPRTLGKSSHRLLFVCTSSRCRSPLAAALTAELCRRRGLPVSVRTGALMPERVGPVSPHVATALAEIGLEPLSVRGHGLTRWDVRWAGAVIALTDDHADAVIDLEPDAVGKVLMLGELDDLGDVFDPDGGDLDTFRACRDALGVALEGLVDRLPVAGHVPRR